MPGRPDAPAEAASRGADQSAFATALRSRDATPGGLTDGHGRPAEDRFRVYRNNVLVSLAEALGATFPATRRLLGEDFFRAAAISFAEDNKPSSPLLFRYGATFPDFLVALPGVRPYPCVPETARIEYARLQAYHAADDPPLSPDALSAVPPELLAGVRFDPHPAAWLVATPHGGLAAWQRNQDPPLDPEEATAALVTRPALQVRVGGLDGAASAFAGALLAGEPLGEAAAVDGLDLAATLGILLSAGCFRGLHVTDTS